MITAKPLIYLTACLLSTAAFAANLRAQVDRTTLSANQRVNLRLEFSGGSAGQDPDLSPLENDFQIAGQGQSTVTKIINGRVSSSRVWDLALQPKHEGRIEIPSLQVGGVASAPIEVQVTHAAAGGSASVKGVSFTAKAAKKEVYKGERVRVDYVLRAQSDLQNLQPPELSLPNAIVERIGEPKVVGQSVRFSYYITPMKEGALAIPPLTIQGEMAGPAAKQDPFDGFMNDDQDDAFAEMRNMMKRFTSGAGVFANFRPVTLTSSPVVLNVLPPVAGVVPWLPANNIALTENLAATTGKVGEPLELNIHEEATGISPAQLPSLEEQLSRSADFKVYPEQAQDSENPRGDSVRDQKFTLIPQKSGEVRLPAIQVAYFDPGTHTRKSAALPARTVSVRPGAAVAPQVSAPPPMIKPTPVEASSTKYPVAAGAGALALVLMGGAGFFLWRKRGALPEPAVTPVQPRVGLKDLKSCRTTSEVQKFLQSYPSADSQNLLQVKKMIEADLYGGRPCDVEQLKRQVENALSSTKRERSVAPRTEWPTLNPIEFSS